MTAMTEQETIRVLREALEDMQNPIAAMQREVPEGSVLNPHMAVQMDVRDAERLDWLEVSMASNHKSTPYHDGTGFGLPYLVHRSPMGGGVGFHGCDSLRAAIDAAMATNAPTDDSQTAVGDKGQGGAA